MYAMFFPMWIMEVSMQMMAFNLAIVTAGAAPRRRSRAQLLLVDGNRSVLSVRSRAVLKLVV